MDVNSKDLKKQDYYVHSNIDLGQLGGAKELLIINPLIYESSHIYVWIDDTQKGHASAQQLFDWLLKKKIYVEGFATNVESLFCLRMYNKIIYDINTLDKEDLIVVNDLYADYLDSHVPCETCYARSINPELGRENLVIWGNEKLGEYIYEILIKHGKRIECFVDTNKNLEGINKRGLPVYKPSQLEELSVGREELTVIEAVEDWQELDKDIQENYEKRFFFNFEISKIEEAVICNNGIEKRRLFCLDSFWMFNHFVGKRIYIYGMDTVGSEFAEYLKLLDYDFAGFLVDDEISTVEKHEQGSIQYVEEILMEENFYVWAYDKKKAKKLDELGLKYFKDYYVKDYRFDVTINQKIILDINLGNNYMANSKYPGVLVYGDEKEDDYKIAVLGGSTTDGTMYPFKSWPRLLYEEMGENITIYNGGVCSYTSGQELIKLVRDIIQLKPDMIIVYDGYNNLAFNRYVQYPFAFLYLENIFEYVKTHMDEEEDIAYIDEGGVPVCRGIASKSDRFENWISDIRAMHAIAIENKISFFSFCQPTLYSKKRKTTREKNILLSMQNNRIELFKRESFRERIIQTKEMPEYIYDLSHIFDEEDDVYMDVCHVWENGNKIIAKEIKKAIIPKVKAYKSNIDIR